MTGAETHVQIIYSADRSFVAAGHEDPRDPGVWKKVLFQREDLQAGSIQMVNWARLPVGRSFAAHFHEEMQEVFVIMRGAAQLSVSGETVALQPGDAVRIDRREVHRMCNDGDEDVEYLAIGIVERPGGRTVVVDESTGSSQ
jgi:mannose-6-phosphate isomerase-like protein (cupin superfamily)